MITFFKRWNFCFCNFAVFRLHIFCRKRKHFFEEYEITCGKGILMVVKKFMHQLFPPEFFASPVYARAIVLGSVYLGTLLLQLFTFEKFADVTRQFDLPGGDGAAVVLTWILPLLSATALPYLISMKLNPISYKISRAAVIITPTVWVFLAAWQNIAAKGALNTGLFGATIVTPVGLWSILFALLWLWASVLCVRELPQRKK